MKISSFILCFFFLSLGIINAQSNRFQFNKKYQVPQKNFSAPNCSDLAAFLKVHKVKKTGPNSGMVTLSATVKNIGRKAYSDKYRPIQVSLKASPNPDRRYEDSSFSIPSLKAGESKVIYISFPYTTGYPDVPCYRLSIKHNSRSHLDNNPLNDDCNARNNSDQVCPSEINRYFRG